MGQGSPAVPGDVAGGPLGRACPHRALENKRRFAKLVPAVFQREATAELGRALRESASQLVTRLPRDRTHPTAIAPACTHNPAVLAIGGPEPPITSRCNGRRPRDWGSRSRATLVRRVFAPHQAGSRAATGRARLQTAMRSDLTPFEAALRPAVAVGPPSPGRTLIAWLNGGRRVAQTPERIPPTVSLRGLKRLMMMTFMLVVHSEDAGSGRSRAPCLATSTGDSAASSLPSRGCRANRASGGDGSSSIKSEQKTGLGDRWASKDWAIQVGDSGGK
ncbi:hypothetical protein DFJ74DRAFT_158981 [Hyaloraphidium curvatum]|nr:hypothetical protein DFJ74DRAFT_158981 [Hyaloraphidium curvatum]